MYTRSFLVHNVGYILGYYLLVKCSVLQVELSILLLLNYSCDSWSVVKWIQIRS
jgi:hypothetical protein